MAYDQELNREVALKEIQQRHADNPDSRVRFVLEAEVTGGLEHPGIVPVYGLGTYPDGRPFYAMRFIRGNSLQESIKRFHERSSNLFVPQESIDFRKLLRRFIDVCQAIEYAHSRGVLHRDLKPGNIMLGKYGETLVVDWGLAKVTGRNEQKRAESNEPTFSPRQPDSGSARTAMGQALGTPAFMSPEQAAGRLDRLGRHSDIYSLGVTLYAVLTGRSPFPGDHSGEVLRMVQAGVFDSPRTVNPRIPQGLEAVCLKAMAFMPEDRYSSALELAEDLENWLADEPVSAAKESVSQRVARWARRHRIPVQVGIAAVLLIGVLSSVGALWIDQARRAERDQRTRAERLAREETTIAQQEADARRQLDTQLRRAESLRLAAQASVVRATTPGAAALLAIESIATTRRADGLVLPESQQSLRDALATVSGTGLPGTLIAYSSDGRWVLIIAPTEDRAQLWDLTADDPMASPRQLRNPSETAGRLITQWQDDDNNAVFVPQVNGPTHDLWCTDSPTASAISKLAAEMDAEPECLQLAPNNRWLVAVRKANNRCFPQLWDLSDLSERNGVESPITLEHHEESLVDVYFGANGRWIAITSSDRKPGSENTIRLWRLPISRTETDSPVILREHATKLAMSADGRWLAAPSGSARGIRLWDLTSKNPSESATLAESDWNVSDVTFSQDGRWMAGTVAEGIAQLWDLSTHQVAKPAYVLRGHTGRIAALTFTRDSHWLATGGEDRTVRLWDVTSKDPAESCRVLWGIEDPVSGLCVSPNGKWLVAGGDRELARLWHLEGSFASTSPIVLGPNPGAVCTITITPDHRWLASATELTSSATLWDMNATDPAISPLKLTGQFLPVRAAAISGDSRWFYVADRDGLRCWDLKAADPTSAFTEISTTQPAVMSKLTTGPNDRWLLSEDSNCTPWLWDVKTRRQPVPLPLRLKCFDCSSDAHWLAAGGYDGTVRLYDLNVDNPVAAPLDLGKHGDSVVRVVMSPDCRWLIAVVEREAAIATQPIASKSSYLVHPWDLPKVSYATLLWLLQPPQGNATPTFLSERDSTVTVCAVSPDSRSLFVAADGTLKQWNLGEAPPFASPRIVTHQVGGIGPWCVGQGGRWLAANCSDGYVRVWDMMAPRAMRGAAVTPRIASRLGQLAVSDDGRWLATTDFDAKDVVKLWDLELPPDASTPVLLRGHKDFVHRLAFDSYRNRLFTGSLDGTIRIWELDCDRLIRQAGIAVGRTLTASEHRTFQVASPRYDAWREASLGNWERAQTNLRKAIELSSDSAQLYAELAMALLGDDQVVEYRRVCREMLDKFVNTQDWEVVGLIIRTCAVRDDSLDSFDKVVKLAERAYPGDGRYFTNSPVLGSLYVRVRRYDEAVKYLLKVSSFRELTLAEHYYVALAYHNLGNRDAAHHHFKAATTYIGDEVSRAADIAWVISVRQKCLQKEVGALLEIDSAVYY